MQLSDILRAKIKEEGPMSFRDFMDMALYYPSLGYYNSAACKIGKEGDFYTSPALSSFFGEIVAKQMEEMWFVLGKQPFTIVEYGAGTGALCADILQYLENNLALFKELKYCIIEKSESMKLQQQKMLPEKVSWFDSIGEIGQINGCILSNELLDNFPVHRVRMQDELMEVFVDHQNEFIEILSPADEQLKNYFEEQNIVLPDNYLTEVNLQAIDWIKEIAENLNNGFVITIDYGFSSNDLYSEKRNSGTLLCYKGHQINNLFYDNIGQQDITAHVNFSALALWGEKSGMRCSGFTSQANFLRSFGLVNFLRKLEVENNDVDNKDLILQVNKLLTDMGSKFKILVQQKGVKNKMLTGLQFANAYP